MGHVHYREKRSYQVSGSDRTLEKCQGWKGRGHQTPKAFFPYICSSHPEESDLSSCSQQADSCIGGWGLLRPTAEGEGQKEKAALNGAPWGAVKPGRPCQVERR